MKKEVILVPKDKCPLDVLAEMGERTRNAWIFLHRNAFEKLQHSDDVSGEVGKKQGTYVLMWEATEIYPETKIVVDVCGMNTDWKPITSIQASDIAFNLMPADPEEVYFLKMDE